MRLPLLAVQATQALQDVTNPTPFPWPTAAEGSVRLSPLATQARTSQAFPPVTNNPPFSFQWPPAPIADSSPEADLSVRLPSLTIKIMSFSRSISGSPRVSRCSRPSASLGHAPDSAAPHTALPPPLLNQSLWHLQLPRRAQHCPLAWLSNLLSFSLPSFYLRLQMLA